LPITEYWLDLTVSLQPWLDYRLIPAPILTMRTDNVIARVVGKDAIRNLLLIATLCIYVLVLEDLGNKFGTLY
jgi:hypothetical protein